MCFWCFIIIGKRGIFEIFSFYVLYSTLLHLPPLRFHCVGLSKSRRMMGSNPGLLWLWQWQPDALTRSHPLFNRFLISIILYESQVHCHCTIDEKKAKEGGGKWHPCNKQPQDKTRHPLFNRFLICIILYESQVHCHCTIDEKSKRKGRQWHASNKTTPRQLVSLSLDVKSNWLTRKLRKVLC